MMRHYALIGVILAALSLGTSDETRAQPIEYVRVCDLYGVGFFYIPGTDQCLRPETGEIRYETEDGTVFSQTAIARRLDAVEELLEEAEEGVAIANALENPDLTGSERFGVAINWGQFEGSNAFGFAATGVVADDLFNGSTRLGVSGAVAVGESGGFGSRASLQLSW